MLSSLAAAVGCANGGSDGPTIVEGDGVRLLVAAKSPAVLHHARITGTVALSKGNCFGLETGGRKILVVWPHGTKITNDGDVDVPDAGSLKMGDSIVVGGGSSSPSGLGDDMPTVPPECATDQVFMINPGSVTKG